MHDVLMDQQGLVYSPLADYDPSGDLYLDILIRIKLLFYSKSQKKHLDKQLLKSNLFMRV